MPSPASNGSSTLRIHKRIRLVIFYGHRDEAKESDDGTNRSFLLGKRSYRDACSPQFHTSSCRDRRQRKPQAGLGTIEKRSVQITLTLSTANVASLYLLEHSGPSAGSGFRGRGKCKAWNSALAADESSDN